MLLFAASQTSGFDAFILNLEVKILEGGQENIWRPAELYHATDAFVSCLYMALSSSTVSQTTSSQIGDPTPTTFTSFSETRISCRTAGWAVAGGVPNKLTAECRCIHTWHCINSSDKLSTCSSRTRTRDSSSWEDIVGLKRKQHNKWWNDTCSSRGQKTRLKWWFKKQASPLTRLLSFFSTSPFSCVSTEESCLFGRSGHSSSLTCFNGSLRSSF